MTERTMLDSIVDCLIAGGPVIVVELDSPCEHPEHSSQTSYRKGCRCHRCATAHNAAALRWSHQQEAGEQP
jgi:hypothetical protein